MEKLVDGRNPQNQAPEEVGDAPSGAQPLTKSEIMKSLIVSGRKEDQNQLVPSCSVENGTKTEISSANKNCLQSNRESLWTTMRVATKEGGNAEHRLDPQPDHLLTRYKAEKENSRNQQTKIIWDLKEGIEEGGGLPRGQPMAQK